MSGMFHTYILLGSLERKIYIFFMEDWHLDIFPTSDILRSDQTQESNFLSSPPRPLQMI